MTTDTPALSIRQPWAELILLGKKTIELRSWPTDYCGRLWVHTGRQGDASLEKDFGLGDLFKGGYLGSVMLEAVIPLHRERWQAWQTRHLDPGQYKSGTYAWILSDPRRFKKPIPGPGQMGLFYPSLEILAKLREATYEQNE